MRRLAPVLALLLAACGSAAPDSGVRFFRDMTVPISSTTRFDAARFAGFWNIRAAFVHEGEERLRAGVEFQPGRGGEIAQIVIHGVKSGGRFGAEDFYQVTQPMPGRFVFGTPPYATEYWVLWVDADYRTAAIGTPSGSFGWIIDRGRSGGEDRIDAAREILEWVGYNMAELVALP